MLFLVVFMHLVCSLQSQAECSSVLLISQTTYPYPPPPPMTIYNKQCGVVFAMNIYLGKRYRAQHCSKIRIHLLINFKMHRFLNCFLFYLFSLERTQRIVEDEQILAVFCPEGPEFFLNEVFGYLGFLAVLFGQEIRIRCYISGMDPELVLNSDLDSYSIIEREIFLMLFINKFLI